MQISNFMDMYIAKLQELVSVEGRLERSLLRMAEVATHPELKDALVRHREETQVQKQRLESILKRLGADPKAHTDQAMQALVGETEKMVDMLKGNSLRDAGLIASAHAGQLDRREDQDMLHKSLEEEKETDLLLTELAKREVNRSALAA